MLLIMHDIFHRSTVNWGGLMPEIGQDLHKMTFFVGQSKHKGSLELEVQRVVALRTWVLPFARAWPEASKQTSGTDSKDRTKARAVDLLDRHVLGARSELRAIVGTGVLNGQTGRIPYRLCFLA